MYLNISIFWILWILIKWLGIFDINSSQNVKDKLYHNFFCNTASSEQRVNRHWIEWTCNKNKTKDAFRITNKWGVISKIWSAPMQNVE